MKIGIYGDSYASLEKSPRYNCQPWCWPNQLASKYDVKNYAYPGTSVSYSYWHFIQTYQEYDLIIFFQTNMNRDTVFGERAGISVHDVDNDVDAFEPKLPYLNNIGQKRNNGDLIKLSGLFKQDVDSIDERIYNGMDAALVQYPYHNFLKTHAMVTAMHALHDNIIHVKCFDETTFEDRICAHNVSALDRRKFSYVHKNSRQMVEDPLKRANHISEQQSHEFFKYMDLCVQGKLDINQTLVSDNVKDYYTASSTFEESGLMIK